MQSQLEVISQPKTPGDTKLYQRKPLMVGLVVLLIIIFEAFSLVLPTAWVFLVNAALIGALFTGSLNLIMGFGRMFSFGQAAYYALGSYSTAILILHSGWPPILAMIAAPFIAAVGAAVFGYFCVRSSGAYFIMLTLAFAQLVYSVIFQSTTVTGGDNGLSGIFIKGWLGSPTGIYRFTVLVVAAGLVFLWLILRSQFGYLIRAIGNNPERAAFLGVSERRYRWFAFIISGFLAGIAGMLFAIYNGSVSPDLAYWTQSAQPFIAIIIGGVSSFSWPLVAGGLLSMISTEAASYTSYSDLIIGIIALVVALFLRKGLSGMITRGGSKS